MEAWNAPSLAGGGFFDKRDGQIRVRIDTRPAARRGNFGAGFTMNLPTPSFISSIPRELQLVSEGSLNFMPYANPTDSYWKG